MGGHGFLWLLSQSGTTQWLKTTEIYSSAVLWKVRNPGVNKIGSSQRGLGERVLHAFLSASSVTSSPRRSVAMPPVSASAITWCSACASLSLCGFSSSCKDTSQIGLRTHRLQGNIIFTSAMTRLPTNVTL